MVSGSDFPLNQSSDNSWMGLILGKNKIGMMITVDSLILGNHHMNQYLLDLISMFSG